MSWAIYAVVGLAALAAMVFYQKAMARKHAA